MFFRQDFARLREKHSTSRNAPFFEFSIFDLKKCRRDHELVKINTGSHFLLRRLIFEKSCFASLLIFAPSIIWDSDKPTPATATARRQTTAPALSIVSTILATAFRPFPALRSVNIIIFTLKHIKHKLSS
jgi:hypothetical protein